MVTKHVFTHTGHPLNNKTVKYVSSDTSNTMLWGSCDFIARTHGCVRNDSETHETVSRLHDRWSLECNSVTPVSLSSHTYYVYTDLRWLLSGQFNILCVTYFSNSLFASLRWWILVDGVADDAVAMLLPLWLHAAALWRHAVWIRIVTSHNAWKGYEYSLQNLNRPRAIHKHNPHPLKTMGRVW